MEQQPETSSNPEFEVWRQELLHRRRRDRRDAWVFTSIGGFVFLLSLYLILPALFTFRPSLLQSNPLLFAMCILLLLIGLSFLLIGIYGLRDANRQPTEQEVAHLRRTERARLFQWAQGVLPWNYRRIGQVVFAVLGCMALIAGVFVLFVFGLRMWDGWIESVAGLLMLWVAFFTIPRERRTVPIQSAQVLAQGFVAGEITEGNPLEDEHTKDI